MALLPSLSKRVGDRLVIEHLIQLNVCCGVRAYRPAGRLHFCGVCGKEVSSDEPYELFLADVTPKRDV